MINKRSRRGFNVLPAFCRSRVLTFAGQSSLLPVILTPPQRYEKYRYDILGICKKIPKEPQKNIFRSFWNMERWENRLSLAMKKESGIIEDIGDSGQKSVLVLEGVPLMGGIGSCKLAEEHLLKSGSYPADLVRIISRYLASIRQMSCAWVA